MLKEQNYKRIFFFFLFFNKLLLFILPSSDSYVFIFFVCFVSMMWYSFLLMDIIIENKYKSLCFFLFFCI